MSFWFALSALAALGVALLVLPAWRARGAGADAAARDQLRRLDELATDVADGEIDPAQAAVLRAELERAVLAALPEPPSPPARTGGRRSVLAACLAVPVLALALYLELGQPQVASFLAAHPGRALSEPRASLELLLGEVERRVERAPDDREAWRTLARAYLELRRYEAAVAAAEKLVGLVPRDADALLLLIDALAMRAGGDLGGRPGELLERLLTVDPDNTSGLVLRGIMQEKAGDGAAARATWRRARDALPADAPLRGELSALLGETPAAAIAVTVALDAALATQAAPDDSLFVLARAVDGPPMPLAVARRRVSELPLTVTLDDGMAMVPGTSLHAHPRIEIVARISKRGTARAAAGDLEGRSAAFDPRSRTSAEVLIDRVIAADADAPR